MPSTLTDYRARQQAKLTKAMQSACTVSPDYRATYHSTPDACECPASSHNPLSPCKHRRVEALRRDMAQAAAVTAKGGSSIQATRDVLYSTLSYYWDREGDEAISSRFDTVCKNFVMNSINRFEARHGLNPEGEQSFIVRLSKWESARALGRTTLTA